jgi:endonuclease/exonuclease/phosphatase family metal-dependent hydrolase
MSRFFLFANVLVIAFTLMAYLSASTSPSATWLFYFFGLAYPWFLLFNLFFILFWAWQKKRFFMYSLVTLLMGWSNIGKFVGTSFFDGDKGKQNIKILTYNTTTFSLGKGKKNPKEYAKAINDFFTTAKADIICLQEFVEADPNLQAELQKYAYLGNYYVAHPDKIAIVILSKFPVLNSGFLNFNTGNNDALFADLDVNGTTIRVYSVHLHSNSVSERTTDLIKNRELDKETAKKTRNVLADVKRAYSIREKQALRLKAHINMSPYPIIVCGDFNDTPQTYTYGLVADGLKDTWETRGFGRGSTYAGAIPFLRIDYILTDPKMKIIDADIDRSVDFSDHFPVTAEIAIK